MAVILTLASGQNSASPRMSLYLCARLLFTLHTLPMATNAHGYETLPTFMDSTLIVGTIRVILPHLGLTCEVVITYSQ